jgi:hypothetical protein
VETEILRKWLPERIRVTALERKRLPRAGKELGNSIRELITIVRPGTFMMWLRQEQQAEKSPQARELKKNGRP